MVSAVTSPLKIGSSGESLSGCRVCVVIPVRNRAEDLLLVLESLSLQTIEHECIVVDQGSTDGTLDVAERFGVSIVCGKSGTVGGLRNEGIALATSELIALVDSDHHVPPNWLANGLKALEENPGAGVVGAPYLAPVESGWVSKTWEAHRRKHADAVRQVDWLSGGNLFFRKKDFERVGGFDPRLEATEDVDFCYRIRARGLTVVLDPRIRNIHRGEPKSLQEFFRKQLWRGGGGWTAWRRHGYPWQELKSLLFPFWVVFGGCAIGLALFGVGPNWGWGQNEVNRILPWRNLAILWILPILVQSLSVSISKKNFRLVLPLTVLYIIFGFARFCSLMLAVGTLFGTHAQRPTNMNADA